MERLTRKPNAKHRRQHTEAQVATGIYDLEQCDALSDVQEGVKMQVGATPSEGDGSRWRRCTPRKGESSMVSHGVAGMELDRLRQGPSLGCRHNTTATS